MSINDEAAAKVRDVLGRIEALEEDSAIQAQTIHLHLLGSKSTLARVQQLEADIGYIEDTLHTILDILTLIKPKFDDLADRVAELELATTQRAITSP